jgi:glycosyltransferase involved in cell wall biosynthesis
MQRSVSIVIPFHNEAECLPTLIGKLAEAARPLTRQYEAILVDDCSTDGSAAIVEEAARRHPWLRLFQLKDRGGQTGAFRVGFAHATGDWIIRMDADLQDDPADLSLFLEKIDAGVDLVIGFRDERQHYFLDKLLTTVYDLVVLLLFDAPLRTFSGSFIAFRAACVKNAPMRPNDHRYLPLIALRRGAERVDQVFVRHRRRETGQSKYRPWRKFALGPFELLRFFLRYRLGFYDLAYRDDRPELLAKSS